MECSHHGHMGQLPWQHMGSYHGNIWVSYHGNTYCLYTLSGGMVWPGHMILTWSIPLSFSSCKEGPPHELSRVQLLRGARHSVDSRLIMVVMPTLGS